MDFNELSAEMQKSLTEFRSYVEREIKEVKANGVAAPETKEALERLNKRIDEIQAKMERPAPGKTGSEQSEYGKAFNRFIRTGDESACQKAAGDAMNVGSNSGVDGGLVVPDELDRAIYSLQTTMSPIRGIVNVVSVSSDNYRKIVNKHGATSGWVGETDSRAATKTPLFAELTPSMGEIYAFPQVTQKLLDDAMFNVESFLAGELAMEFDEEEAAAFVTGDGTNKPKGFMAYTWAATDDGTRAFGQTQYVKTAVAGGWPATDPQDIIVDLVYKLKAAHRQGARFVTNKALLGEIRKFKDGNGNQIWQPALVAGQPSTLLGYPVTECEDIAAKGVDSYSLVFGDFKRAYTIVDRIGTRMLRDPFTNKPYVGFYATRRVGGMLVDSEAIKALKFAA